MLAEDQAKELKKQIIAQINASFPEEKRRFAVDRIEAMTNDELETFLARNNLKPSEVAQSAQQTPSRTSQCVFCSIVSGEIESQKIDENESAIAVLEINPVSKGHILIIPREHVLVGEKQPENNIKKLIKNISSRLKKKLKPKEILTSKSNLFGHETINVIPRYDEENPSQRHPATPEELLELRSLLEEKKRKNPVEKNPKKAKLTPEEKLWLPRRIP